MTRNRQRSVMSTSRSRRQVLIGAGSMAVCLGALSAPVLANAGTTAPITAASFTPCIDQLFFVDDGGSPRPSLKLVKVLQMPRSKRPNGLRDPFSLIFTNPSGIELASDTYEVLHPQLGWIPMFLSPISSDFSRYEAAFS